MFKDFLLRKMVAAKMKNLPTEEREKITGILEKDPQFFQKIAAEVEDKMKNGKDQMAALMEVMNQHKNELENLIK